MEFLSTIPGRIRIQFENEIEYQRVHKQLTRCFKSAVYNISFNYRTLRALLLFPQSLNLDNLQSTLINLSKDNTCLHSTVLTTAVPCCRLHQRQASKVAFLSLEPFWIGTKELILFLFIRLFLPAPLRPLVAIYYILPSFVKGVKSLLKLKIDYHLLDAVSMSINLVFGDLRLVNTVGFLVRLNEKLEAWSKMQNAKKIEAMATQLLQDSSHVSLITNKHEEIFVPVTTLKKGHSILCRGGQRIAVDGYVVSGRATVDETMIKGVSTLRKKYVGAMVFAGSYVVSGQITVCCQCNVKESKIMQVTQRAWQSVIQGSQDTTNVDVLVNKLAGVSFLASALLFAITRNIRIASAVLMVDYSCVLKLAIPFGYQAGLLETAKQNIYVKGNTVLENLAKVDTLLIRDTGCITEQVPKVVATFATSGNTIEDMLSKIACLEEHFSGRSAQAIARYTSDKGIAHEELHGEVDYIKGHGLVAYYGKDRVVVGNQHFLEDDEGVDLSALYPFYQQQKELGREVIFVALNNTCIGALSIEEVLRPELRCFLKQLRKINVDVFFFSDKEQEEKRIFAAQTGLKYVEINADTLNALKNQNVALIGDCYLDEKLAQNVSVFAAMPHESSIVQQSCDIMLHNGTLLDFTSALWVARNTSLRVQKTTKRIIAGNVLVLVGGLFGALPPVLMSVWHNGLTATACLSALKPLDSRGRGYCRCSNDNIDTLPIIPKPCDNFKSTKKLVPMCCQ